MRLQLILVSLLAASLLQEGRAISRENSQGTLSFVQLSSHVKSGVGSESESPDFEKKFAEIQEKVKKENPSFTENFKQPVQQNVIKTKGMKNAGSFRASRTQLPEVKMEQSRAEVHLAQTKVTELSNDFSESSSSSEAQNSSSESSSASTSDSSSDESSSASNSSEESSNESSSGASTSSSSTSSDDSSFSDTDSSFSDSSFSDSSSEGFSDSLAGSEGDNALEYLANEFQSLKKFIVNNMNEKMNNLGDHVTEEVNENTDEDVDGLYEFTYKLSEKSGAEMKLGFAKLQSNIGNVIDASTDEIEEALQDTEGNLEDEMNDLQEEFTEQTDKVLQRIDESEDNVDTQFAKVAAALTDNEESNLQLTIGVLEDDLEFQKIKLEELTQEIQKLVDLLPEEDSICSNYYSCDSCTANLKCGWCPLEQKCQKGTKVGPSYTTCSFWQYGSCSGDKCFRFMDCNSCLSQKDCGWCHNQNTQKGTCMNSAEEEQCYGNFYESKSKKHEGHCPAIPTGFLSSSASSPVESNGLSGELNTLTAKEKEAFYKDINLQIEGLNKKKASLEEKVLMLQGEIDYYKSKSQ